MSATEAVTSNQSGAGSTGATAVGSRAADVKDIKMLKSPQEGGSKHE